MTAKRGISKVRACKISCYTVETSLDGETWTLREDVARECSSG